ncbi:hypothetical protein WHI96_02240 [Pseudonocardia tropica]|uniref:Uncharacterized protein n=1 Tax=Pseudonocardia tropica TaxID=681289 RepID=A0ABV1JNW3_9PSEU
MRCPDGFEVVVHGGPDRTRVADRLLADRGRATAVALRLLGDRLAPRFVPSGFHAGFAEVHAERSAELGDLELSFTFSGDDDPHADGHTRFDVHLRLDDERWHAVRFAVGFW